MTYITVPTPSFVTGAAVDNVLLNANYTALQNGLRDGTKSIYQDAVTVQQETNATHHIHVGNDMTALSELQGARAAMTIVNQYNGSYGGGSGYLTYTGWNGDVRSTWAVGFPMPRSGSVVGYAAIADTTIKAGGGDRFTITFYKNGTSMVAGNTIDATAIGTDSDTVSWNRYAYQFAPGDLVSAYYTKSGAGTWGGHLSVVMDVQLDT